MSLPLPGWLAGRFWHKRWQKAAESAAGTPLAKYYATPPPNADSAVNDAQFVALDFESDGLGKDAALLEAGWVDMTSEIITLSRARRERITSKKQLQESAVTIHQITDSDASRGRDEADVLAELVTKLAGKVVLAHAANIEAAFLNAACLRQFDTPFVGRFVCTMHLEDKWFPKVRAADGLRLGKLRAAYGLPWYRAHDGLTDAIACGELFLAQMARRADSKIKLGDILMSE